MVAVGMDGKWSVHATNDESQIVCMHLSLANQIQCAMVFVQRNIPRLLFHIRQICTFAVDAPRGNQCSAIVFI